MIKYFWEPAREQYQPLIVKLKYVCLRGFSCLPVSMWGARLTSYGKTMVWDELETCQSMEWLLPLSSPACPQVGPHAVAVNFSGQNGLFFLCSIARLGTACLHRSLEPGALLLINMYLATAMVTFLY